MVAGMKIDYKRYKHPAVVFSVLGVTTLLLILGLLSLDRSHNTHRWIHCGGISLQPSELAKPALILFPGLLSGGPDQSRWMTGATPCYRPLFRRWFSGAHRLSTRPWDRNRLRRYYGMHHVCRRARYALSRLCFRWRRLLPLYFLIFHVAYRRDRILAFIESVFRSAGQRLPYHSVTDCGEHGRHHRVWV